MTATCWSVQPICPEIDDADDALTTRSGFGRWSGIPSGREARFEPSALAELFNDLQIPLLHFAIRQFVDAVSSVAQVEQVVLFSDEEGTHVWTALRSRDWDAETAVLDAHRTLRRAYPGEIDLFALVARRHELAEMLPAGLVSLYTRE